MKLKVLGRKYRRVSLRLKSRAKICRLKENRVLKTKGKINDYLELNICFCSSKDTVKTEKSGHRLGDNVHSVFEQKHKFRV